jgi:DNA-binding transcriptional LysR family regulator
MGRLDLRLVEYFVAVAEELHFGRAAERLHIAQPSLSQQIRRLEQQLGVTLLERDSRNVHLTDAGEVMLREGRRILNQAQHLMTRTRAAGAEPLTVGFYGSAGSTLLADVLSAFSARHPAIDVSVRELLFGSLEGILDGKVDLAFTRLLPEQTELAVEILTTEPRLVALPATHPLATREKLVFADLREESFIVNPVNEDRLPPSRWLAEQRRHALPGRIAGASSSLQEIITLVAAGRGVCLLPATVALHDRRSDIVYIPVTDADPAVVSLAWRPGELSPIVRAFIDTARKVAGASRSSRRTGSERALIKNQNDRASAP